MRTTVSSLMLIAASGLSVGTVQGQIQWDLLSRQHATSPTNKDDLGCAVALNGDWAAVGAEQYDTTSAGYVAIFQRTSGAWNLQTQLDSGEGVAADNFGHAVAFSGDNLAVGAFFRSETGASLCGAVYTFHKSGTTWSATTKVLAKSAISTPDLQANAWFGYSVAMKDDLLVVGCPRRAGLPSANLTQAGAVYVYNRSGGGSWDFAQRITLGDSGSFFSQAPYDKFGWSVATNGTSIVIGCPGDDSSIGTDTGAVYEYVLDSGVWKQNPDSRDPNHGKFTAGSLYGAKGQFGNYVAANSSTYLVGIYPYTGSDPHDPDPSAYGKAFVFGRDSSYDWQVAVLTPPSPQPGDGFGISVALDESGRALVGANERAVGGTALGQAFVFDPDTVAPWTWNYNGQPLGPTTPYGNGFHDWFGAFVAIQGWTILVGSHFGDVTGTTDAGVAYFFGASCYANCDGSTGSPLLNGNDFQCFLNAFGANSAYANCDGSTAAPVLNANDFQCFLDRYAAGCT